MKSPLDTPTQCSAFNIMIEKLMLLFILFYFYLVKITTEFLLSETIAENSDAEMEMQGTGPKCLLNFNWLWPENSLVLVKISSQIPLNAISQLDGFCFIKNSNKF